MPVILELLRLLIGRINRLEQVGQLLKQFTNHNALPLYLHEIAPISSAAGFVVAHLAMMSSLRKLLFGQPRLLLTKIITEAQSYASFR